MCSGLMLTEEDGGTILTNRYIYTDPLCCMPAKTYLWMTCKSARGTPLMLSGGLTETIVGGGYRGVSLGAAIFHEPGQPLAARGRTTTEARAMVAADRDNTCLHALCSPWTDSLSGRKHHVLFLNNCTASTNTNTESHCTGRGPP